MEPESISRFERGATLPSLATLEALAKVLDTTIADLLEECPGSAYSEEQRLATLMVNLSPPARAGLVHIVECFCRMLDSGK
jgi:transcriptional regulator with XRE-family HTH domain